MQKDTGTGWPEPSDQPESSDPAEQVAGSNELTQPIQRPGDEPTQPIRPAETTAQPPASGAQAEPTVELAAGSTRPDPTVGPAAGSTRPQPESDDAPAEPVDEADAPDDDADEPSGEGQDGRSGRRARRLTGAGAFIAVLLGLLGFAFVVQIRNNSSDSELTAARPEDLVRILSDLQAREDRLRQEISKLEESQRQLQSGAEGRQTALDEARRRADELGILAGTLPAEGDGLVVVFRPGGGKPVKASAILDAVQELRGAGAEAMQIAGAGGEPVRIVASTAFVDGDGGLVTGGQHLSGPFTVTVIGDPETMRTALYIPGGVVESVTKDGGTVTVQEPPGGVQVSALHRQGDLQYAEPSS